MDKEQKYIELIKIVQQSLDKRRDIELKYNLGIWFAIGICHYYLKSTNVSFDCTIFILYFAVYSLHSLFSIKVWHSNDNDHNKIGHYKEQINDEFKPPETKISWLYKYTVIWHFLYIVFTGVLLYVSSLLLTVNKNELHGIRCCKCCLSYADFLALSFVSVLVILIGIVLLENTKKNEFSGKP